MAWDDYFRPKFISIIDECKLDLTAISSKVTHDVAERIPLEHLLLLKERSDKFISNVFRFRIDILLAKTKFHQCKVCMRLLTQEQAELIPCSGYRGPVKDEDKLVPSESYYTAYGAWFTHHAL